MGKARTDPEPNRCTRTNGKLWRCSNEAVIGHKHCEKHVNEILERARKTVSLSRLVSARPLRKKPGGTQHVLSGSDHSIPDRNTNKRDSPPVHPSTPEWTSKKGRKLTGETTEMPPDISIPANAAATPSLISTVQSPVTPQELSSPSLFLQKQSLELAALPSPPRDVDLNPDTGKTSLPNSQHSQGVTSSLLKWLSTFDDKLGEESADDQERNSQNVDTRCEPPHKNDKDGQKPAPEMVKPLLSLQQPHGGSVEKPMVVSLEDVKPESCPVFTLKCPKPRTLNQPQLSEQCSKMVPFVVSLLVTKLTETSDLNVNQMIDVANSSFMYLDSLSVDYLPLYEAVRAYISHHCDKDVVARECKNCSAFQLKAQHCEILACISKAEEARSKVATDILNAKSKLVPLGAKVEEIKQQLKEAEEKLLKAEAEVVALESSKASYDADYAKAARELIFITPQMDKADSVIRDIQHRQDVADAGISQLRNEFLFIKRKIVI